jgi:hypothetical protein
MAPRQSIALTPVEMSALGSMPVHLVEQHGRLVIPWLAPSSSTLALLANRGLIELRDNSWVRTALGEATWEDR